MFIGLYIVSVIALSGISGVAFGRYSVEQDFKWLALSAAAVTVVAVTTSLHAA